MTAPEHGFVTRALARNQFVRFILDEGGNPFGGLIMSAAVLSGCASSMVLASLNGASNALATDVTAEYVENPPLRPPCWR